ncbi:hypothetical protein KIN20_006991 [Parelaphostrongylus tenuis]|uniref:Uncharacterized protein n=1 Tax=Parelaphostrongylus tenuis TaxID=148309 RepID=A0AAD5QIS5_PARTN|nr:hypothetical protein KIN20_006991 [Parelaphostrongylus tenuis]
MAFFLAPFLSKLTLGAAVAPISLNNARDKRTIHEFIEKYGEILRNEAMRSCDEDRKREEPGGMKRREVVMKTGNVRKTRKVRRTRSLR